MDGWQEYHWKGRPSSELMAVWHLARGTQVTNVSMLGHHYSEREQKREQSAPTPSLRPHVFVSYTRHHLCIQQRNLELFNVFRHPCLSAMCKVPLCCSPAGALVTRKQQPLDSQTLKGLANCPHCSQELLAADTSQAIMGAEKALWARCAVTESERLPGGHPFFGIRQVDQLLQMPS